MPLQQFTGRSLGDGREMSGPSPTVGRPPSHQPTDPPTHRDRPCPQPTDANFSVMIRATHPDTDSTFTIGRYVAEVLSAVPDSPGLVGIKESGLVGLKRFGLGGRRLLSGPVSKCIPWADSLVWRSAVGGDSSARYWIFGPSWSRRLVNSAGGSSVAGLPRPAGGQILIWITRQPTAVAAPAAHCRVERGRERANSGRRLSNGEQDDWRAGTGVGGTRTGLGGRDHAGLGGTGRTRIV